MIEIDFVWVGDKSNTGDAIACRFTHPITSEQVVMVIDGGFSETGTRVADLIQSYYETTTVDLMVCTHPDDDHIRGLFTVLDELHVRRLLIHQPSAHGFDEDDEVKADLVDELISKARSHGTVVDHGFAGTSYFGGVLTVAGPTKTYYEELLREQAGWDSLLQKTLRAVQASAAMVKSALTSLADDPGETLTGDNGGTTPRNNSSIVLDLQVEGHRALFTGDAGVPGLTRAADALDDLGKSDPPLDFFQVPHHGSRHNVDPEILDRLLGTRTGGVRGSAFVSVAKLAPEHPRPEVSNAIRRRGYPLRETRGINIRWNRGGPDRAGYTTLEPLPWFDEG